MNKKICFLLFMTLSFCISPAFPQAKNEIKKIVIDAGHGGTDPGALGAKSKEKDITLALALEIGKRIKEKCSDVEVLYTRTTDVYPTVKGRATFANNKHADLFISIHCNAAENKTARGVETWVMGLGVSDHSFEVARRENASILLEDDYKSSYGDFDPNSPESYVILSMFANAYLDRSTKFAAKVQRNLVSVTSFPDRKVQQGSFWVLHSVAMPSILIEFGFISNPTEEAQLMDAAMQLKMAEAVASAFQEYKNEIEGKTQAVTENKDKDKDNKNTEKDQNKAGDKDKADDGKKKNESVSPAGNTAATSTNSDPKPADNNSGIRFKVQLFATPDKIAVTDTRFSGLEQVDCYFENSMWKYTSGNATTYAAAQELLKTAKAKFPDAFIISFQDGKKIPVSEARKLAQ